MAAMSRLALTLAGTLLVAAVVHGGPVPTADPKFHGDFAMRPAGGSINRRNGNATLKIRNWTFEPAAASDGIYPDQEPIIVAVGEDTFRLEAGKLRANRKGTAFVYRASAKETPRGVRLLRLGRLSDGSWTVRLVVGGVDLSRLNLEDPICRPMAVIVGDDDGFGGITLTSPSFTSRRVVIPLPPCDVSGEWVWITQ
jgi:hypothetical protein